MNETLGNLNVLEKALHRYRDCGSILWDFIGDYACDQASTEVQKALRRVTRNLGLRPDFLQPRWTDEWDTMACGFCTGLAALPQEPWYNDDTIVYHNVAPRKGVQHGVKNGEGLLIGVVQNGDFGTTVVLGPNAGWSWSQVKGDLMFLGRLLVDDTGEQFRSRGLFPFAFEEVFAKAGELEWISVDHQDVDGTSDFDLLGDGLRLVRYQSVDDAGIPDIEPGYVACRDNYGNAKLTTTLDDLTFLNDEQVLVRIGDRSREGVVQREFTFSVGERALAYAPGSSVFVGKTTRRHLELFLVGGRALDELQGVPGDMVVIETANQEEHSALATAH